MAKRGIVCLLIFGVLALIGLRLWKPLMKVAAHPYERTVQFFSGPVKIHYTDSSTTIYYRFRKPATVTIPRDLRACHAWLDSVFAGRQTGLDSTGPDAYRFGIGSWMRNNWGLRVSTSRISHLLQSYGLKSADEMSGFILSTYLFRHDLQKSREYSDSAFYAVTIDSLAKSGFNFQAYFDSTRAKTGGNVSVRDIVKRHRQE